MEAGEVALLWVCGAGPIMLLAVLIIALMKLHDRTATKKKSIRMPTETLIVGDYPFIDITVSTDERFPRQ